MKSLFGPTSPLRFFASSFFLTLAVLAVILVSLGLNAAFVTAVLIAIEVAFSFDNAVINAKTLGKLSRFWQRIFLTVGIVIAVLGMRVVFPIVIVMLTAHLSWGHVVNLALHHPEHYARALDGAHASIAAFGGGFLLLLALHFFFDDSRDILWLQRIERPLQKFAAYWIPPTVGVLAVGLATIIPANHHKMTTLVAGFLGLATFTALHLISMAMERAELSRKDTGVRTGMSAFLTFVYLEVLDASFSFDGVIGAFAITTKVILIAAGLGVGAIWVRSLTVFMVRRGTLKDYIYLEHGAHYTIAVLALVLLLSIFVNIPDLVSGAAGIAFITAAVISSRQALAARA